MSEKTGIISLGEYKKEKEDTKEREWQESILEEAKDIEQSILATRNAFLDLGIIGQSLVSSLMAMGNLYNCLHRLKRTPLLERHQYKKERALNNQIDYFTAGMLSFHLPGNYQDSEKSFFEEYIPVSAQWATTPWDNAIEPYKEEVGPGYALTGVGGPFPILPIRDWLATLDPDNPGTPLINKLVEDIKSYPPMWTYEEITPERQYLRLNFNHLSAYVEIVFSKPINRFIGPINTITLVSAEEAKHQGIKNTLTSDGITNEIEKESP